MNLLIFIGTRALSLLFLSSGLFLEVKYSSSSLRTRPQLLWVSSSCTICLSHTCSCETKRKVWNTNIQSGTKVILAAFDSGTHQQGGSSDLLTIQGSSDNSCIDSSSPSSTSSSSQATQTGTPANSGGGTKTNVGGVKTVTAITTETASPGGAAGYVTCRRASSEVRLANNNFNFSQLINWCHRGHRGVSGFGGGRSSNRSHLVLLPSPN